MDLNADLGEGFGAWSMGDDAAMLHVVTSANIACGFHAGDPIIMRATVQRAYEARVAIGAHVAYPDLRGFGRRELDLPARQIRDDVLYQIGALDAFARSVGTAVRYIKPHGALYHRISIDSEAAGAVVGAIAGYDESLALLTLPGSVAVEIAGQHGLRVVSEGFADRRYRPDGGLVDRRQPGAVLHDPAAVVRQALSLAGEGRVETIDGSQIEMTVDSLCIHGDSPGALGLARAVRVALESAGISLRAFAEASSKDRT